MKITGIILTKNEEKNIAECIKSIRFCDEIIIIDDNSIDKTSEIANKLGAIIHKRSLNRDYAKQKNFALGLAKSDWVMYLDADERISQKLKDEIFVSVKSTIYSGFYLRRKDYFLGKWLNYGEISAYRDIRLMKRDSGKWKRSVHEYFEIKGNVGELKEPLLHFPHNNLNNLIKSTNRWSSWHSRANSDEGKKSSILKIIFWPKLKFIQNYILRLGFLDGINGFSFAVFMSFHSYLGWSKLWLLQRKS